MVKRIGYKVTQKMDNLNTQTLILPITQTMRQTAEQFARQHDQATPEKQDRIRQNTLAVSVVNNYLAMMAFETDLASSDSWDPLLRQYADVADLKLPAIGRLDCRPIDPDAQSCSIPLDIADDTVGVVGVTLNDKTNRATLLGFTEKAKPGSVIRVGQLRSLDHLLQYLGQLEAQPDTLVNLKHWIEGLFEEGWQTAAALIGRERWNLALGFMGHPNTRSGTRPETPIQAAKLIDLGVQLGDQDVVLLMAVGPPQNETTGVRVQLHPSMTETHLPPDLRLTLLSESGERLREVPSRDADNFIQLPLFRCQTGEKFAIQISLGDRNVIERFAT
ncbi:MAG: DUF1822 family protein [Cyanobacteria bacterium P01_A01_bin.114]